MKERITLENCIETFTFGYYHVAYEGLKITSFTLICNNWVKIQYSGQFTEMMKNHPKAAMEIINNVINNQNNEILKWKEKCSMLEQEIKTLKQNKSRSKKDDIKRYDDSDTE